MSIEVQMYSTLVSGAHYYSVLQVCVLLVVLSAVLVILHRTGAYSDAQ